MTQKIELGDVCPAGFPYQGEGYTVSFPQLVEQHADCLPNTVESIVIQINSCLVLMMIEQGKNTLAVRAASRYSIRTLRIPSDKEKRDFERRQKIGRET
jgi:hypothetical protein